MLCASHQHIESIRTVFTEEPRPHGGKGPPLRNGLDAIIVSQSNVDNPTLVGESSGAIQLCGAEKQHD